MTTLNIQEKKDYTIVQIDNGKVNGITTQLLADLKHTFLNLDKEENCKGVILTGKPHCFSAGIDIKAIVQLDLDGLKEFWVEFLGALQAMIRFSKPYVCAVTGYAPAGGTMLACTGDYRIMGRGEKHKIGMHEFKMSLQIPKMLCEIYAYTIGEKRAWEAVQKAKLFSSDEAYAIGLVNESVEVKEVLPRAEKYMKRQLAVYDKVFIKSKRYLRKGLLAAVDVEMVSTVEEIVADYNDPRLQMMMQMFVASLKK